MITQLSQRSEEVALKKNMSEWIMFYNKKHNEQQKRIELLEQRLAFLERKELQKGW